LTVALVTGISGQDGSLLAEQLRDEGVEVVGLVRPGGSAPAGVSRTVTADLADSGALRAAIAEAAPDELYHLAAPTFVPASWEDPGATLAEIAAATAVILDAAGGARVVVTSSSEVFGDAGESPQRETSPMRPRTPYGIAKLAALHVVRVYREQRGIHASAAITINHESERRPERFVTRKVTRAAAAISLGRERELVLGDLDAVRDWSAARDIVAALRLMARAGEPDDYVLASGVGRTVGDLVRVAFAAVGLEPEPYVRVDESLVRAPERTPAVGDPSRAAARLGWRARTTFEDLIGQMVRADLARMQSGAAG
jgi:GDPmannose 4,6-dehydratase